MDTLVNLAHTANTTLLAEANIRGKLYPGFDKADGVWYELQDVTDDAFGLIESVQAAVCKEIADYFGEEPMYNF
ncbi:hypothetical protein HNP86_001943 [Methanococcus maripaludis]|uniref:Uncharacterized protein n=1 Tax=Methanococcus maripaludis TaxID=39152 RepID=A0A7J9NWZ8_METMI|nr:hypothetical protein [Methanococcus maripaludis]MBA2851784.1 hypothetical protein [Methanococcus maripaludis]